MSTEVETYTEMLKAHGKSLKEQDKKLNKHAEHIEDIQKDLKTVKTDLTTVKTDVSWLKDLFKSMDRKIWALLISSLGVVITVIIAILLYLLP